MVGQQPGKNTVQSRSLPMHLHVFLDGKEQAEGRLYRDDGESLGRSTDPSTSSLLADPLETGAYSLSKLDFHSRQLTYSREAGDYRDGVAAASVWVVGLEEATHAVILEGQEWHMWQEEEVDKKYYVHVTNLTISLEHSFTLTFVPVGGV